MELLINRVSKQFRNKIAVDNISLNLTPGVYGLLGANGAGKTTLMRMICGILTPDRGTITLDGREAGEEEYRESLGYLPQDFGYYPEFTGMGFLMYLAALKGIPKSAAKKRCLEMIELTGLKGMEKKKIKTYSGGMIRRLGIAQALINRPRILVLDEPTAGLDPKERVRFREMIARQGENNIVLLSTHIVSDVEQIADKILMMKEGQLIFEGTRQETGSDLEKLYLEKFGEVKGCE